MRNLAVLALLALGAYAGLCLLLFLTQRSSIYFPVPPGRAPGATEFWVERGDARIRVWSAGPTSARALLYFGGNAEDVAAGLPDYRRAFPDHALYLVNYRGYGGSTGRPTEAALAGDALAVYDAVRARHDEIDVMGRSLGSGIAAGLAARREVRRLVLVTPYDSLVNVAREHYRWLPVGLLMLDRYESAALTGAIRAPVLAVVAGEDEIIPRRRSDALVAAFPRAQVEVQVIEGASHNDLHLDPRFYGGIASFLAR